MDSDKLILTEVISPPSPLMSLSKSAEAVGTSEEQKKQIAKDFESVFIHKLLEEMKNSIGDWGFEKDAFSKQVKGIFWLYLARDIANNGGFGMWKDIHRFLTDSEHKYVSEDTLDKNL